MKFYPAQVVNIIQSIQRDESFIDELQDFITSVLQSCGHRYYNNLRNFLPQFATTLYYLLTSVSNLQTLGEEYTDSFIMKFYPAQVANIIQSIQRDESFIDELQDFITSVLQSCGHRYYNNLRNFLPQFATTLYYLLTSVSNLQTLGEEYTGIIRLNSTNKIPSKYLQIFWLVVYVGGEPLLERIINYWEKKISKSVELRSDAKNQVIRSLKFLKANKDLFLRLHYSVFYINSKYYNVSNRITGINYVFLRKWMQNETASTSFKLLGLLSSLYVIYNVITNFTSQEIVHDESISYSSDTSKICILCVESHKNCCATSCGHLFCWECIYDSLKYQQNCPVCREFINPSRIVYLQNY